MAFCYQSTTDSPVVTTTTLENLTRCEPHLPQRVTHNQFARVLQTSSRFHKWNRGPLSLPLSTNRFSPSVTRKQKIDTFPCWSRSSFPYKRKKDGTFKLFLWDAHQFGHTDDIVHELQQYNHKVYVQGQHAPPSSRKPEHRSDFLEVQPLQLVFPTNLPFPVGLHPIKKQRETYSILFGSRPSFSHPFRTRDAFLFGYGVPVLALLVVIVFSLIRTAFVVRQSVDNKTREKIRRKRKLQLFLYIKLTAFISAVALLSAIYMLSKIEIFWILFNIFQEIQGTFITLCVACNCNVLKIYTKSLSKGKKRFEYRGISSDLSNSTSLQLLAWDPTPHSV